jgi:hypothetical protein
MSEPGNTALTSGAASTRNFKILLGLVAIQFVAYDLGYLD